MCLLLVNRIHIILSSLQKVKCECHSKSETKMHYVVFGVLEILEFKLSRIVIYDFKVDFLSSLSTNSSMLILKNIFDLFKY